jgi:hypothetical protein
MNTKNGATQPIQAVRQDQARIQRLEEIPITVSQPETLRTDVWPASLAQKAKNKKS